MKRHRVLNGLASAVAVLMIGTGTVGIHAQTTMKGPAPVTKSADKSLADELSQLREQVAKLQSAVGQKGMAQKSTGMPGMQSQGAQSGMQPQGAMGMMSMMENERSSSMSSSTSPMPMQGMSGMEMMGRMAGAPQMAGQAALPGFPGLSHLYHVGATDFFLDHPEHITLSADQQKKLGQIKEKALLERASAQRKIDEAEQQLFTLTGADQPKLQEIQAQVKAIGELQGLQRVAYIQAVGQAAQVLTDEQRKSVVGSADSGAAQSHDHH
jgi:hypothetical protein